MLKDDKYGNIEYYFTGIPESMEDDTVLVRLYMIFCRLARTGCHSKDPEMESYREFLLYIAEENNIFE